MSDTGSRTLRLLSLLQTHRYWSGDDLADRLEISIRTLRRDVDRLRELGYPVRADRGVGGGYQLAPGASLPPLVLDDEEAVALAVGLRAVTHDSLTGMAEASLRALAKVTQVMPKGLRRRVQALDAALVAAPWEHTPQTDPETLVLLAQACRDAERVGFGYQAHDGTLSDRRVEPAQVVQLGPRWYLVGYDLDRSDWRNFRLDRISRPTTDGRRFAPRTLPGGDAVAFVRAGQRASGAVRLTVVLAGRADDIRARIGRWAEVTQLADPVSSGSGESSPQSQVVMSADSVEWAAFAIGVSGAQVIGSDSAELIELLAEWSRRFVATDATFAPPA